VIRTTTERELVRRATAGSADARAELFRRHLTRAWRSALLVTGSRSLADDATQEGFMAAFAALDQFDDSRPFAPWVGRIVVNRALNMIRADARGASRVTAAAADEFAGLDRDTAEQALVRAALATLCADQRAVVALRFWLDLSGAEIAQALDVPVGTVRSRLSRALQALRRTMEEQ
jgi:RNA polymerase sigma factor (sigma-70 family)